MGGPVVELLQVVLVIEFVLGNVGITLTLQERAVFTQVVQGHLLAMARPEHDVVLAGYLHILFVSPETE